MTSRIENQELARALLRAAQSLRDSAMLTGRAMNDAHSNNPYTKQTISAMHMDAAQIERHVRDTVCPHPEECVTRYDPDSQFPDTCELCGRKLSRTAAEAAS